MGRHSRMMLGLGGVIAAMVLAAAGARAQPAQAPRFELDPYWMKTPPGLLMGDIVGVAVDAKDNVWVVTRPGSVKPMGATAAKTPPEAICCKPAPPVMQFDSKGNYLRGWGGPGEGYEWPAEEHGAHVDHKGNIWIGGAKGDQGGLNQVLKFSPDGKFLLQIGKSGAGKGSLDTANLGGPADVYVHPATNELFVADGYINRRVIVFDADTGAFKRMWGAYGNRPEDAAPKTFGARGSGGQHFWIVHGLRVSKDGLVYVADRHNNRLQVFTLDGKFVKEGFIARDTRNVGSVFGVAFSADPEQRFVYVPDASNGQVHVLDRQTLTEVDAFGSWGPYPGQFEMAHSVAVDSKGDLYVGEVIYTQRLQKWVFKGLKPKAADKAGPGQ